VCGWREIRETFEDLHKHHYYHHHHTVFTPPSSSLSPSPSPSPSPSSQSSPSPQAEQQSELYGDLHKRQAAGVMAGRQTGLYAPFVFICLLLSARSLLNFCLLALFSTFVCSLSPFLSSPLSLCPFMRIAGLRLSKVLCTV
jgi:hypothetical protein